MQIRLYKFNKKQNSTKVPTSGGTSLSGEIRTDCSVLYPVFELKTNPLDYNYCYVPSLFRYYFISDVTFSQGLWLVKCTVDVLATYKTAIGNTSSYIVRASNRYDGSIVDNLYPANTSCDIQQIGGTDQSSTGHSISFSNFSSGYYVMGVQGYNSYSQNAVVYYVLTPSQFTILLHGFYGTSSDNSYWGNIGKGIRNSLNNISDFICSCRWYPFKPATSGSETVYLGSWSSTITADLLADSGSDTPYGVIKYTIPRHPKASTRGTYLNFAPYTKYDFYDPLIGLISLNPESMKSYSTLYRSINLDFTTGEGCYTLYNYVTGSMNIIYMTYIKFGVDVPLNGDNVNVAGLMGNAGGAIAHVAAGDFLGAAMCVGNALATGYTKPPGRPSSGSWLQMSGSGQLIAYFMDIVDADNTNRGRPCCQVDTPANITGYMEIEKPHVSIQGTDTETDMINSFLQAGFYYE